MEPLFQKSQKPLLSDRLFLVFVLLTLAVRFFYFGSEIDEPHAWRQCDTAQYIRDLYRNGFDIFHPSVCWMGGHKTLILEFPLPEFLIALLYTITGEHHETARAFFLLFFALGLWYYFRIAAALFGKFIAQLSTLVFSLLPLSLFYSRALHIDYFVLSLSLGMFWHFMQAIQSESKKELLTASLFAVPAFLVKAPYAFYFAVPLIWMAWKEKKIIFFLRNSWMWMTPVVLFIAWMKYSTYINSLAPDWEFIPGYRKFDDNTKWYFGSPEHRLILRSWKTLGERFMTDLAGVPGLVLVPLGLYALVRHLKNITAILWITGVILYLLIFFNLNVIHNYYQIPFTPIIAFLSVLGALQIATWYTASRQLIATGIVTGSCIYFLIWSHQNYYWVMPEQTDISKVVKDNTNPGDLVLISLTSHSAHCPNMHYRADRLGWSIPEKEVTTKIIYRLMDEGCSWIALARNTPPEGEFQRFLNFYKGKDIPIRNGYTVYLRDLKFKSNGEPYNKSDYAR